MTNYFAQSLAIHQQLHGKIAIAPKISVENRDDLSIAYTPGVAAPCEEIAANPARARELTIKHNTVAVVSDGSAVLGLGNLGPLAAIPVMEGKALLFKRFADIDAWPLCLDTQDSDKIVETVKLIAPVFGGINLEDISAPRCFEIEKRLQNLGIPVFHDDQHGTAIVVLAALINCCKITGQKMSALKVLICGAGAAGTAIARLLRGVELDATFANRVAEVIMVDSKGAIHRERTDLGMDKKELLTFTNPANRRGSLQEALRGMDVFIGVGRPNLLTAQDVQTMANNPIIFALSNPTPEIMPDEARKGGAAIVATGRSDFPNQVNNALVFPGIFRGALDAGAAQITPAMKVAAAYALADATQNLSRDNILPDTLDRTVASKVATAVKLVALASPLGAC